MNRVAALPLTDEQRATLARWVRAGTTLRRLVFRRRIVWLAASGMPSKHVARQLDTSQATGRLWRRRFTAGGPDALRRDAPGRGRKRQITALLHEYPLRVGRRGPHFSGPSAGATLRG